jgi:predicted Rossmann-fold nucleotide-binding protein
MKLAITGSRAITDKDWVYAQLDNLLTELPRKPNVVLSGGANGVDTICAEWAADRGIDFVLFKPYHLLDNKARFETKYFFTRNRQLVDNADLVVALWNSVSNGTKHTITYAERKGKPLKIIER